MARHDDKHVPTPELSDVKLLTPSEVNAGVIVLADGSRRLALRVYVEGEPMFELDLTHLNIPAIIGGLEASTGELLKLMSIDEGLDHQAAAAIEREAMRRLRRDANRQRREDAGGLHRALTCSRCSRPVSIIDTDGSRYCKRHAEELGIRPRGKIGGGEAA